MIKISQFLANRWSFEVAIVMFATGMALLGISHAENVGGGRSALDYRQQQLVTKRLLKNITPVNSGNRLHQIKRERDVLVIEGKSRVLKVGPITAINYARISERGTASMLEVSCLARCQRVTIRGLRLINRGRIQAREQGSGAAAAMLLVDPGGTGDVDLFNVDLLNLGKIEVLDR